MFVCLSVWLLSATRHLSTLRRCLRVAESRISRRRERPRARGQAHAQQEHARAWRTTSQRKNRCADAFQKQNRTRAHAVVYVTAEIFKKKGNRKPTCHFPSSVYSLPSLGVFTFRIVHILISHFKQNYWQEETSYLIFGRSRPWSARLYLKKSSVCLSVCFLSATRHLSTLRRCLRVAESRSRRGRPRARAGKHAQREHARACRTTSQRKKSYADAFQKQNRTRAHAVVYVTAEIFKKGKKKTNMPLPKFSLQFGRKRLRT